MLSSAGGSASREGSSPIEAYSWELSTVRCRSCLALRLPLHRGLLLRLRRRRPCRAPIQVAGGGRWRQSVLRVRLSAAPTAPPDCCPAGVEGEYKFQLTVTDAAGQTDSANVTVLVKRRGLNGRRISAEASDDTGVIAGWLWQQLDDGNKRLRLLNSTSQTVNVTGSDALIKPDSPHQGLNPIILRSSPSAHFPGLAVGKNFRLRVTAVDQDGANSSAIASLTVLPGRTSRQKPSLPRCPLGCNLTALAESFSAIDGSASWDDKLVTGYRWTRLSNSSAAGFALNGSASQPVLLLANLLPGRYTFRLTVRDVENASGFADVAFEAVAWPSADAVVVLELRAEPASFQQQAAVAVLNQLRLVAPRLRPLGDWTAPGSGGDGLVRLRLVADNGSEGAFLPARQDFSKLDSPIQIRNLTNPPGQLGRQSRAACCRTPWTIPWPTCRETCQLTCSGRGVCDPASRTCRCHWLWMANPTAGGPNCDWSLVYVCLALAVALLLCCRRLAASWPPAGVVGVAAAVVNSSVGGVANCYRRSRRRRRRATANGGDNDNSSDYYESESADDCDYEDGAVPLASMPNDELRAIVTRRSAAASLPAVAPPPSPPSAQSVATNTQSHRTPTPAAKEK
uniref:Cadherin domain-containing protein n=1 Tax=Macrostomum lignano TaxID=282301 RepID=A0A1I8FFM8_9PLAT